MRRLFLPAPAAPEEPPPSPARSEVAARLAMANLAVAARLARFLDDFAAPVGADGLPVAPKVADATVELPDGRLYRVTVRAEALPRAAPVRGDGR